MVTEATSSNERTGFEAWADNNGYGLRRKSAPFTNSADTNGDYTNASTQDAWEAWQARASLRDETKAPLPRIRLKDDIYDDGADHHPPGIIAHKGDVLEVRELLSVGAAHPGASPGKAFIVRPGEFEEIRPEEPTAVCKRCNGLRFVVSTGQIGVPCPECNAENGTDVLPKQWWIDRLKQQEVITDKFVALLREANVNMGAWEYDDLRNWQRQVQSALGSPVEPEARREYHANGTYWSGVPTVDLPCDFCKRPIMEHNPRTHACPSEKAAGGPFARKCDRCKKLVHSRQPVTSTVFYCSIECAE